MGKLAAAGGVTQLWVTDNLNNRNPFSVLAALASEVPVDLGTAVLVQYFHSPVEVAGAAGAISEIMGGRELSLGISRGNYSTPNLIDTPKPVSMLRETAQSLNRLLAGDKVTFDEYPTVAKHFNLMPTHPFKLSFTPPQTVHLFCGGNAPLALAVGGQNMDGLIFGGTFQAVALTGRLPELLKTFDEAGAKAGRMGQRKVAEIKISLSNDHKKAREFAAISAGTRLLSLRDRGFTDEDLAATGARLEDIERFDEARKSGAPREQLLELVSEEMIDAIFIAGDPIYCQERIASIRKIAATNSFEQLMFSEFGPDPHEGLRLLCDKIVPAL
jgi:alkanesulfonate monooxygenase SsuD/methylene tetrahydromethanopterin reductase-like flavin-dependent oxidoreductase (luciferase family)